MLAQNQVACFCSSALVVLARISFPSESQTNLVRGWPAIMLMRKNCGLPMRTFLPKLAALLIVIPSALRGISILDFSNGFADSASTLNFNNSARISGTRATITDGGFLETGSVWSKNKFDVRKFTCQFTFQITPPPPNSLEAGFTFAIQRAGNTVFGYPYESLAYDPIAPKLSV